MGAGFWTRVAVSLAVAAGAGQVAEGASVRYQVREGGRILVPVSINGAGTHLFLFDTGADTTVLDAKLVRKLGLQPTGKAPMRTFAGLRTVDLVRVESLELGSWSEGPVEAVSADLSETFGLPSEVQGILGQDFLSRVSFLLLLGREHRLEIDGDGKLVGQLGGERLGVERKGGRYYVRGQVAGASEPRRFLLDSGIPYPVVYEDPGLQMSCSEAGTTAASAAGTRKLRPCRMPALQVGPVALRNLSVQVAARLNGPPAFEDGILPLGLFDAIYFDHAANSVIRNPVRDK